MPPSTGQTYQNLQDQVISYGWGEVDRDRIKQFINDAYRQIASERRWSWTEATQNIATTAGTGTNSLGALTTNYPAFWGRLMPTAAGQKEPKFLDMFAFDQNGYNRNFQGTTQGMPTHYTIHNDTITWYPIPDAIYTYALKYWRHAVNLSANGDYPLILPGDREVLVYGALYRLAMRQGDAQRAALYKNEYEAQLENMRRKDFALKQNETELKVPMPPGYHGWFD